MQKDKDTRQIDCVINQLSDRGRIQAGLDTVPGILIIFGT